LAPPYRHSPAAVDGGYPALRAAGTLAAMSKRLRITDVVRVPLREPGVVGDIEPAWNPGSVNRVLRGGGAYLEIRTDAGIDGIDPEVVA